MTGCAINGRPCPRHVGAVHGREADELRRGVEALLAEHERVPSDELARLLARVDARDALAYLEATARRAARAVAAAAPDGEVPPDSRWRHKRSGRVATAGALPHNPGRVCYRYERGRPGHPYAYEIMDRARFVSTFARIP